MRSKKKNVISIIIFVVVTELIGYLSSFLSGNIGAKYMQLVKPPLSPPKQIFGVVWPILYALMAFAAAIVYNKNFNFSEKPLNLYFIQLIVNFCWSIIFFRLNSYWLALIVLIILDILVIYLTVLFHKFNKISFILILPYLIWILFATYLNLGIALLN